MRLINFLIIFGILVTNVVFSKEKPPFKNILVLDEPKVYKEIIFQDRDGAKIDLNSINTDEIYILNFWATWCAPCISELPSLAKLESKINNSKFKLLLISIDRSGPKVFQPFLKRLGLASLKSGSDPKASLMRELGLTGIPTTLLISPTGKVVGKLVGTAKWDTPSAVELVNFYLRN